MNYPAPNVNIAEIGKPYIRESGFEIWFYSTFHIFVTLCYSINFFQIQNNYH